MKTSYTTAIALAIATLAAGQAFAADVAPAAKTRDQVRAELFEARRTGDMLADGALAISVGGVPGSKLNALFPNRYPAQPAVAGKTRDDVMAEMAQARKSGDLLADGALAISVGGVPGSKLNAVFPNRYPAQPAVAGKTRDDVRAELAEAQRTGDMLADESLILAYGGVPGAKLNELFPSRYPTKARADQAVQTFAQR